MFKTSVKGFKKSDVNNYIITIHREFAEEKEALEEELSRVRGELQTASDALAVKDASIDELTAQICEISALKEENEKLKAENNRLYGDVSSLLGRVNALTDEASSLTLRAEAAENTVTELKAELKTAKEAVSDIEKLLAETKAKAEVKNRVSVPSVTPPVNEKDRNGILSRIKGIFA